MRPASINDKFKNYESLVARSQNGLVEPVLSFLSVWNDFAHLNCFAVLPETEQNRIDNSDAKIRLSKQCCVDAQQTVQLQPASLDFHVTKCPVMS